MSWLNSWSRKTVRPSFRLSWNQSRQVTRLPVQLWKVLVADHAFDVGEVGVGGGGGVASTYLVLKMFRPLFSMAPMLKSLVATIMKQITGLRKRILPAHPVTTAVEIARTGPVAVAQQYREALAIGDDRRRVARKHVGAIRKERDAPKSLGFALRAVHATRKVQPLERGVFPWLQFDQRFEFEAIRNLVYFKTGRIVAVAHCRQRDAVEHDRAQHKRMAVEPQRSCRLHCSRIAHDTQATAHSCGVVTQFEVQIDVTHQIRWHMVVTQQHRTR
jgi:hypothetical protein